NEVMRDEEEIESSEEKRISLLTDVFVDNTTGSDETGDGTSESPVRTLEKAYEEVPDGGRIILKADVLLDRCMRVTKNLTMLSESGNKYTIKRADNFKAINDVSRSWYNPAMIEVAGSGSVSFSIEDITLDDANLTMGTEYKEQGNGNTGGDTTQNLKVVHDGIISIYNPQSKVSLSNTDLLNFAGLSALCQIDGTLDYSSGLISGGANQAASKAVRLSSPKRATIGPNMQITNLQGGTGVYSEGLVTFGGEIKDTTTEHAITLLGNSEMELTASSRVHGNKSTFGGVIYARGSSVKLLIDGEISGNKTLKDNAGAVYAYQSNVTIEDNAKIIANESTDPSQLSFVDRLAGKTAGAGIFASENANITMNGGIISDNISIGQGTSLGNSKGYNGGGGVAIVRNASFTMNDGKIVNNKSNSYGGGIVLHVDRKDYSKGKIVLNGGEISGNTAPDSSKGNDVFITGFKLNEFFATESGNYISANEQVKIGDGISNGRTQLYAMQPISFGQLPKSVDEKLRSSATAQGYEAIDSTWINSNGTDSEIKFGMKAPEYDSKINDLYIAFVPVDKLTGEPASHEIIIQKQKTVENNIVDISMDVTTMTLNEKMLDGQKYGVLLLKGPHENVAPVIKASDKVLFVGDLFNPLDDVSVSDFEDGEIKLNKENITFNDVDTSKAGNYQVTYSVVDSAGATANKTIAVTVNTKVVNKTLTNATFTKGSKTPVSMVSTGLFENFKGILINGMTLKASNYNVKSGSTIVTYKTEFLESLEIGEHKIVFLYDDGNVEGTLTILNAPTIATTENNPKTGMTVNLGIGFLLLVGVTSVVVLLYKKRMR
ncbi:MAG: DUF5011 domain-containing protein, partial [Carnobacterium sp.]